ncbi:unnamed protein product [Acanthoscelides obtectus]|uniref:Tc1-like transposase DDE domain-containing protein n=1 Tax=Acanthoscelides obtectus TaxID=200917 RepID=A0A9P0P7R1_ACAOB|nr:unnamed protein product [Acanthoscelides obtectus]CAK1646965.1 hypothetical protein AOBTE_LOCUS14972 [Acanthoscelides obtectus]
MNYLRSKEEEGVLKIMDWPSQSPDVNPIELLWDEFDRQVKNMHVTSEKQLFDSLKVCWESIATETLQKLVRRLPRICAAIIKARRGHIDEKNLI